MPEKGGKAPEKGGKDAAKVVKKGALYLQIINYLEEYGVIPESRCTFEKVCLERIEKACTFQERKRENYPTERLPKRKPFRKADAFKNHNHYLRKSITPGTVLIMLAGPHRGKRVVFLKQFGTGLLLVTGPLTVNGCPLKRVNQIYVIVTSTKLDISNVKIPEHLSDPYFRRMKLKKKSKIDEEEIFETKKERYVVTEQRKKDQKEVDKQILDVIRKHPEKNTMIHYLRALFYLQNKVYPHKMKF
ncbi:60S ribosomal protein L6 [Nephila pilipes]|uniref:Large ribosomal subunit protein eL6 n=1 Tax=Nephila pilipes TaxID=299642 RepID=A0A8X6IC65_NEPPI|nr:60S ribosomal protein L6 [Nephila pilipes]